MRKGPLSWQGVCKAPCESLPRLWGPATPFHYPRLHSPTLDVPHGNHMSAWRAGASSKWTVLITRWTSLSIARNRKSLWRLPEKRDRFLRKVVIKRRARIACTGAMEVSVVGCSGFLPTLSLSAPPGTMALLVLRIRCQTSIGRSSCIPLSAHRTRLPVGSP
jgi:hypothetical protein